MKNATKPRSVADSIEEIGRWRATEEARYKNDIGEIDREIVGIRAAMANLQERLAAQEASRGALDIQSKSIAAASTTRTYQALFATLTEQATALSDRAGVVAAAEYARVAKAEAALAASAGTQLDEYRQFKTTVEPSLGALPESYRKVLLAHHAELAQRVQGLVDQAFERAEPLKADPVPLDVVWAIDAPDGTPDLLVVVVPADEAVTTAWADRGDDTELWLAARVVQALSEALVAAGLPGVRPALGGHLGLLAIEVDLTGAKPDFGDVLQMHLERTLSDAVELVDAQLRPVASKVEMDWLLPPETTERGDA